MGHDLNPILEGLNEPQKEAVLHQKGPILILAGAGSGKTRVITHRIANLIATHSVFPFKICALTFTNKAAGEMKERVMKLLPNSGHLVMVKTFHSLCLFILRKHPELIGLKSGFTVYDSSLQDSLLKEVIKDMGLDIKAFKPSVISNHIQHAKDSYQLPDEFGAGEILDVYSKTIKEIYKVYEERKTNRNAVDFGDLILQVVRIFENYPEILNKYNELWEYILIDEYQDTNHTQYKLALLLAGTKKNLCVVGDDDQSIYSWRGADIRNILDFEKDFPGTKIIKLEENYRSTSTIIGSASELISNNTGRKDKTLFTNNPTGEKISILECYNEYEESQAIVSIIKQAYKKSKNYRRYAIFYRTNAQSRFFEDALRTNSIPYKIFGGFRFFDRMEIKDMIAYLSVLVNPLDTSSLLRIINFPPRGVGEVSIEKLRQVSVKENTSLYSILSTNDLGLRKQAQSNLSELFSNFEDLRKKIEEGHSPSSVAKSLVVQMKIDEELEKSKDLESTDRLENIEQFIESIQEYEENSESPSLEEYLNQISLITSEEEGEEVTDFVTLMTVHNSKGLEFEQVFLSGMENGTFPHRMNMESLEGLEEERRLCYVAITRAKEKLFISYSMNTRRFGETENREPSIFLEEIPVENFEYLRPEFTQRFPSRPPNAGNRKTKEIDQKPRSTPQKEIVWTKGMHVRHKEYGKGIIINVSGTGDNTKVKIAFGQVQKNFLVAYTILEPVF
jgi:DNA helicase II / ATP-dependent DNA helicase PcrA